jgi:hypothetical protein
MQDDAIRAMLGTIEISSFVPTRPGCVALLRSRIENTGADIEAIEAYLARHGGAKGRTRPIKRRSLGPHYGEMIPGEDYYEVPRSALPSEGT